MSPPKEVRPREMDWSLSDGSPQRAEARSGRHLAHERAPGGAAAQEVGAGV